MSTIELSAICVSLQNTQILDSITTSFPSGEFAGLIGPNGAGKTTLLRTINGRLSPTTGTITIAEDPIGSFSSRQLGKRIATVQQTTNLSFDFTVRQIVEMGRHPHQSRFTYRKPAPEIIDWAIARTDITHLENRPITDISGGERQRVLIARALAQDTPVLLLDEPTANLDINHQIRTLELARSLVTSEDKTVIAAIHDLDLAARFCDTLYLLDNNEIVAQGPPTTVLTPQNIESAFGTDVSIVPNPITGTPSVTATHRVPEAKDLTVHVIGGSGSATSLLYELHQQGYTVTAGIHHETDPEQTAADHLGIETTTAAPYTTYSSSHRTAAQNHVDNADVTILANLPIGPHNRMNLDLAKRATTLVIIEDTPFESRNAADEEAAIMYRRLTDQYPTVTCSEVQSILTTYPDQFASLVHNTEPPA